MKTANVYEIERALQQPITPEQRQTAAANNPVAALIAQRLDGVEGSLRTKLQTPPPPQGTVMNQYYQWPQQQPEMGLAQPGLEEMAQQYAAGGLVAFADGGPVYDYDGGNGYAEGGLASMLPMGYAGEEDMPVFNGYADGGGVLKSVFPATFDEDEYEEGEGENFGDVGSGVYGLSEKDLERDRRQKDVANRVVEGEAMQRYSAGPGDIIGKGVEGVKKIGSSLMDMAFNPALEARQAEYYKTTAPPPSRSKPAEQGIAAVPTEEPGLLDRLRSVLPQNTESGEDRKQKETIAAKGATKAAEVAAMEKPVKAKKASVSVPSANPVRTVSTPAPQAGTSAFEITPTNIRDQEKIDKARAGMNEPLPSTQSPEQRAIAQQITNSPLSADQQIAAIEKYFQTDTSEAMRIKGEMEKENAHAGNVGIMAVLANALGMGLGTYGTGAARWGAGLMGAAQGFMSEEDRAARRQEKINELGLKVKEMEGSGTRKAAELVLNQRAKAAAEADELKKAMLLERMKAGSAMNVANVRKAGQTEAAQISADARKATQGAGGEERLQVQKDRIAADLLSKAQEAVNMDPTSPGYATAMRSSLSNILALAPPTVKQLFPNIDSVLTAGGGRGSVTPDLVIGRIQGGQFVQ